MQRYPVTLLIIVFTLAIVDGLSAQTMTAEQVPGLARLAEALTAFHDSDTAKNNEITSLLGQVHPAKRDLQILDGISHDAKRSLAERCAALVMMSCAADPARTQEILAVFQGDPNRLAPVVLHLDDYAESLSRHLVGGLPGIVIYVDRLPSMLPGAGNIRTHKSDPPPESQTTPTAFQLRIVESDLPILARLALVPEKADINWHNSYQNLHPGLAQLCLSKLQEDTRAGDVLLFARDTLLGDRPPNNSVFFALQSLCSNKQQRDNVMRWLGQHPGSSPRRTRAMLALAANHDERVLKSFDELIFDLASATKPALPYGVGAIEVLDISRSWGDARLAPALENYLCRRGQNVEQATAALQACGGQLKKAELWRLFEHASIEDAIQIARLLKPMLQAEDTDTIISLLDRSEWKKELFWFRVGWMQELPDALLSPAIEKALLAVTEEHPDWFTKSKALESLGRFSDPALPVVYRRLLETSPEYSDAGNVALQLLIEKSPTPEQELLAALADTKAAVRLIATRQLSDLLRYRQNLAVNTQENRNTIFELLLVRLTEEPLDKIRYQVILALGTLASPSTFDDTATLEKRRARILPLLARYGQPDTNPELARAVIGTLWNIGNDDAIRLLDKIAKAYPDKNIRELAEQAIGQIREREKSR
jgi:hypothetical protein